MYERQLQTRSPIINIMAKAAFSSAKRLIRDFNELGFLQVSKKGPSDFVSTADKRSEQIIFNELKKARPDFAFLMEESGEIPAEKGEHRWIVDPLDGTTNFLHGVPHFCISIALEKNGVITSGVIYDPIKDEIFWAEKGLGAHMNNQRLRVSSRRNMTEALLATGIPFCGHGNKDIFVKEMEMIPTKVAGIRRMGSASLDLAYVAAGRYDAYWERYIHPWDTAAGIILVQEAGGFLMSLTSEKKLHLSSGILAGNESIFKEMKNLLK